MHVAASILRMLQLQLRSVHACSAQYIVQGVSTPLHVVHMCGWYCYTALRTALPASWRRCSRHLNPDACQATVLNVLLCQMNCFEAPLLAMDCLKSRLCCCLPCVPRCQCIWMALLEAGSCLDALHCSGCKMPLPSAEKPTGMPHLV